MWLSTLLGTTPVCASTSEPAPTSEAVGRRKDVESVSAERVIETVSVEPSSRPVDTVSTATSNLSVSPSIDWQSPPECPSPRQRLDELLRLTSKHPLWGRVEVGPTTTGYRATLHLSDAAPHAPDVNVTNRTLEGNTCPEVTEAALLVISIMQREREELEDKVDQGAGSKQSVDEIPPSTALPAPAAPEPAYVDSSNRSPAPIRPSPAETPTTDTSTTLALAAAGALWNGKSPAVGLVAELEHRWGRFGLRPQLAWSTAINPIPTSRSVRVDFETYDVGLRACFHLTTGLSACGGPTIQRITVVGSDVEAPTESSAWFPGASIALLGSQNRTGLGLWGAIGANVRFKEIALDVSPLGTLGTIKRLTVYAWVGPQWRWR